MGKKVNLSACVVKTLDVCTSMIPRETEDELRFGYDLQRAGLEFSSVMGGGWMIAVNFDSKVIQDVSRLHSALGFLLEFCARNKIGYLKLDWRAPELDGFVTFDWREA